MSNLRKVLANVGKKFDGAIGKVEPVIEESKKRAYGAVARIEHDLYEGKSVLRGLAKTVSDTATKVGGKTKSFHEDVKARGGYIKVVDEKLERTGERIDAYFNNLEQSIEREFYTDGTFDRIKAKQFLSREAEVVRVYGQKFFRKVSAAVQTGKDGVIRDYRSYVPTREELETSYAGIGTAYDGILLREDFESCLKFLGQVEKKLPLGRQYRNQILVDVKASASANIKELLAFYENSIDNAIKRRGKIASALL